MTAVDGLEPRGCWRKFEELTRIARPSGHEELVIEHVRGWADGNGFAFRQDAGRNPDDEVAASVLAKLEAVSGRPAANMLDHQLLVT